MRIVYKDVWEKNPRGYWEPTTKEEYEAKVLPKVMERYRHPNCDCLFDKALIESTRLDTLFFASPDIRDKIEKRVMANFLNKLIERLEENCGYRHRQEISLEE